MHYLQAVTKTIYFLLKLIHAATELCSFFKHYLFLFLML